MIIVIKRVVIVDTNSNFSARYSLEGFLYQFRYALLESLKRDPDLFTVSIDTLDDIVFDKNGELDLLQTKNHNNMLQNLVIYHQIYGKH